MALITDPIIKIIMPKDATPIMVGIVSPIFPPANTDPITNAKIIIHHPNFAELYDVFQHTPKNLTTAV